MARLNELKQLHPDNPILQHLIERHEQAQRVDRRQLLVEQAADNPILAYLLKRLEERESQST